MRYSPYLQKFFRKFAVILCITEENNSGGLTFFTAAINDLQAFSMAIFSFFLSARFGSFLILLASLKYSLDGKKGRIIFLVGLVLLLFGG